MRLHLGFAAAACLLFTIPALASPIYIGVISFNELIPVAGSTRRIPVITAAVEDSSQESEALAALTGQGVSDSKAQSLLQLATPAAILEQIEYASHLMSRDRRGKFENPAGFIIYSIENSVPIPKDFTAARKALAQQQADGAGQATHRIRLEEQYEEFIRTQVEREVKKRFIESALAKRVESVMRDRVRKESRFAQMNPAQQREIAEQMLRREVRDSLPLPSFEQWNQSTEQMNLFADVGRN